MENHEITDRCQGELSRKSPFLPGPMLREREAQLEQIGRVLEGARRGEGGAVFVVGEAGTGKSALVGTVAARADGSRVVSAKGHATEADLPFAFAEQLLGPLQAGAAHADPISHRALVYEVARTQVASWAAAGNVLIALDDLHWADPDSLALIGFLGRRLATLPVALIAALRPWPLTAARLCDSLSHEGLCAVVHVGPLSQSSSAEMLEELLGGPPALDVVDKAVALSNGNPYLLVAAADAMLADGDLPEGGAGALPALKTALLLSYLAGLSPAATHCAQVAAVLGGGVRLRDAEAVAQIGVEVFAEAVDTLVAAGLLVLDGTGRLRYIHDLLAGAIGDDIPAARRRLLHRRAFEHFADTGRVELATFHALLADVTGDERAVEVAAHAATRALGAGGVESALDHLAAAVRLSGDRPSEDVLLRQADLLVTVGRSSEALSIYTQLLRREGTAKRVEMLAGAARAQVFTGSLDDAVRAYDDILGDSPGLQLQDVPLVMERAHVIWQRDGPGAAAAALDRDLLVLGPLLKQLRDNWGETPAAVRDHFALQAGEPGAGSVLERFGESIRRRRLAGAGERAVDLPSLDLLPLLASAWAMAEQWEDALALVAEGMGWYREVGAIRATGALRNVAMGVHLCRGMPAAALAEAEQLSDETDLDALHAPVVDVLRAQALAWLGRIEEALEACNRAEAIAKVRPWFVELGLLLARGEAFLATGAPTEALAQFRDAQRLVAHLGIGHPQLVRWCAGAIDAALQVGSIDDADGFVSWLTDHSAPGFGTWTQMVASAGAAGCAAARGDDAEAERLYRAALALPREDDLDRARIALRYGSWLRRKRRAVESRPVLADALRVAEERGAVPLAARAAAELAAAGGRRRRAREASSLTPQEARVADLASCGSTTKEIAQALYLSPRTVETHLAHIYGKLGVTSRAELAAARGK